MRKDVKTGMLAGVGLAMFAAVLFSLFADSVTVERQKRFARELQNQTDTAKPTIAGSNQTPENPRPATPPKPQPTTAETNSSRQLLPSIHIVKAGQTLTSISMQYYGTADGCKRILEANADIISNPDRIPEGMRLLIPPQSALNTGAQD